MSAPAVTGISHVDLSVTDLESSVAWYTELLGMVPLFGGRNENFAYDVQYLMEPQSGVVLMPALLESLVREGDAFAPGARGAACAPVLARLATALRQ